MGFWKTQDNYLILTGNRIFWSPGKPDLPKFGHGIGDFFNHMLGIREILCLSSNYELTRRALSGISSKTGSCMITRSNQTIETVCFVVFFLERKKEFGKEMSKIAGCGIFMKKEWELYHI